ncbi:MAG: M56 family metallopeptidase [Gemmatimonadota bacterium]
MTTFELAEGAIFSRGLLAFVQATAILLGALALERLLRRTAAESRHALWTAVFASLLALPALVITLPTIPLPIPWPAAVALSSIESDASTMRPLSATAGAGRDVGRPAAAPNASGASAFLPNADWTAGAGDGSNATAIIGPHAEGRAVSLWGPKPMIRALVLTWILGTGCSLVFLLTGLLRSGILYRASRGSSDATWTLRLERARASAPLDRSVSLRFHQQVRTGLAGGLLRPFVLLPDTATDWSPERRELVLAHELVHLKRRDPLRRVLLRLVLAIFWFHPLAWYSARRAVLACEEACDQAVVRMGYRPSTYARHLLALATPTSLPMPALARLRRPSLEVRIMKLLEPQSPRRPRLAVGALSVSMAWAITVAATAPVPPVRPLDELRLANSTPTATARSENDRPPAQAAPAEEVHPQELAAPAEEDHPAGPAAPAHEAPPPMMEAPAPPSFPGATPFDASVDAWPNAQDPSDGCRIRPDGVDFEDGADFTSGWGPNRPDNRFQQRSLGPFMLCLRSRGQVELDPDGIRIAAGEEAWLVLAVRGDAVHQRLEITPGPDGNEYVWFVGGIERPFDVEAAEWRDLMVRVQHTLPMRIAQIRGESARLRAGIAVVRGREAQRLGELARVRGDAASLRGEIARIRATEAVVASELMRARGGAADSLRTQLDMLRQANAITIADLEEEIRIERAEAARLEAEAAEFAVRSAEEIQAIEERIAAFNAEGQLDEIRTELASYDAALEALIRSIR